MEDKMDCEVADHHNPMDKMAPNQFGIGLQDYAVNHGLSHLVNQMFSHLNPKELAICRMVSKSLRDHVDNNKQWWIFQLETIKKTPTDFEVKTTPLFHYRPVVTTSLIETQFPEWKVVNEYFINEKNTYKLKTFVLYMWKYFNDRKKGVNPFHYAASKGNVAILQLLMESPFDFNSNTPFGDTIFHMSVRNSDPNVPKFIFEQFKDDFKDAKINSLVIHTAIKKGQKETIDFLLKSRKRFGIKLDTKEEFDENILHLVCAFNRTDVFENVVNCLKEDSCGIDANTPNHFGFTSLHFACKYGTLETLKLLLSLHPNVKALTNRGQSIIHIAAAVGPLVLSIFKRYLKPSHDVLQYLLESYPSMAEQTDPNLETPLHVACEFGFLENVKVLFECPNIKSFDAADKHGNTPLHLASCLGRGEVVKYILSQSEVKSIDVNKKNKNGKRAEDMAILRGRKGVIEMFKNWKLNKSL